MAALIEVSATADAVSVWCGSLGIGGRRDLDAPGVAALTGFAEDYRRLLGRDDGAGLLALGRALYRWLDGGERWLERIRDQASGALVLEVQGGLRPRAEQWALLHAPWEVLADAAGFLALDTQVRFVPVRRLGARKDAPLSDDYRLGIAFMAAAPRGVVELDFEAEETALLGAAGAVDADLLVEDSGDPAELGRRLRPVEGGWPVLHLSCHGHNAWRRSPGEAAQPVLLLEDSEGGERPTPADQLIECLGAAAPRLVFLSACLSARAGAADGGTEVAHSLATALVRGGVPAVVGWDGSVADAAATAFARAFYGALAGHQAVGHAAALARRTLLAGQGFAGGEMAAKEAPVSSDPADPLGNLAQVLRRNWHLARVWLGPQGGGPVAMGTKQRSLLGPGHGHKELLRRKDPQTQVAAAAMFVGRRRELQTCLRVLRGRDHAGVLLRGLGRQGKSSLAARVASRRPDLALAVVVKRYDALAVVEALAEALAEHPPARDLLKSRQEEVRADAACLEPLLIDLLAGPCRQAAGGKPVLLLIDDLERVLEPDPAGGRHRVKPDAVAMLRAVLRAFTPTRSESRVVLTSRVPFTLPDGGEDLAGRLHALQLPSLSVPAQRKLSLRQMMAAHGALEPAELAARLPLLEWARAVSRGNPGLQDLTGDRLVLSKGVPAAQARAVLDQVAAYLSGGDLPAQEEVRRFIEGLTLETLLDLAGDTGRSLLRAATLFGQPVPERVLEALAEELGGAIGPLCDLGLLDPAEDLVDHRVPALAVNGLVAGRLAPLSEAEQAALAGIALPVLFAGWGGAGGAAHRPYAAAIELTRLGLLVEDAAVVASCAPDAVRGLDELAPRQAAVLGRQAVALLDRAGMAPSLVLLSRTASSLIRTADAPTADGLLERGLQAVGTGPDAGEGDPDGTMALLFEQARRRVTLGWPDEALMALERVARLAEKQHDAGWATAARGQIADILQARGQLDEALAIRREETLPVYERLGDVRSIAVTRGQIADILQARGQLDEALEIRRDEELPVYERLGDVRSIAVTKGQIADILQARGQLDEALAIRRDEELPVYERLGAVRESALIKGRIADILEARGQLDEALAIRRDEELPVYERLGDVRSIAVTKGKIADILQARGQLDEALALLEGEVAPAFEQLGAVRERALIKGRIADILEARGQLDEALAIRREETLPVYERLGDVREIAVTKGQIADILQARGQLDEALALLEGEVAPAFEQLGAVRESALIKGRIADILQARGQLDEALAIRRDEELPVYERLGDVRSIAVTKGQIADILQARGQLDEALAIRREETLPVYERLGDVRAVALTKGQIADILQARGQLDEALAIRQEEELPVYERLGDVRSIAVTKGKIADILQARGQLDEALALLEDALTTMRDLGDLAGIASTLWRLASIELKQEQFQNAAPKIAEAYQLLDRLGRADGLAVVGITHGQFLIAGGRQEEGLAVLRRSAEMFMRLGQTAQAQQVEEMIRKLAE